MTNPTNVAGNDLDRVLGTAQLPALPQSAIQILEFSKDPNKGPSDFALPIECDPGLAGQVLRFVNSSYFGFSREISSVKLAITLVGIRTIKNFTLWTAVFSLMPNPKCGPFDLKCLWQDSLRRGLFARTLGKILGMRDAEDTFAAALLQDIAVPLLAKELTNDYTKLLDQRSENQSRLSELEKARFGWTHAEAASRLARKWNLPEELAAPIERHTQIDELLATRPDDVSSITVALSALLPAGIDSGWGERDRFEAAYAKVCPSNGPQVAEVLAKVDQDFVDFAPVLKMTAPAKSLVEYYNEACAAVSV